MRYHIRRCNQCYSCCDPYYAGQCSRWTNREIEFLTEQSIRFARNFEADVHSGQDGAAIKSGMQDRASSACYRALLGVRHAA